MIIRKLRKLAVAFVSSLSKSAFDPKWYLERYPDVAAAGLDPHKHYRKFGKAEGRFPTQKAFRKASAGFDSKWYLAAYPDIAASGLEPFDHFIRYGRVEGRSPAPSRARRENPTVFARFGGREYGPITKVLKFDAPSTTLSTSLSLCAHVHLFHADLADEVIRYLNAIPQTFTLLISVPDTADEDNWARYIGDRVTGQTRCVVRRVPNRGRDVAPWVVDFANEIMEHDLFVHVHTKKSDYDPRYRDWRRYLFHTTLGSTSTVTQIVEMFDAKPALGVVYPAYFHELRSQPTWGGNLPLAKRLSADIGIPAPSAQTPDFPAGSFFWARTHALRPLLEYGYGSEDFEAEVGDLDSTLAHAIERMITAIAAAAGYVSECVTVDVSYNLIHYYDEKRVISLPAAPTESILTHSVPYNRSERLAVVTCVTGNFEQISPPATLHPNVDYFVFTDSFMLDVPPPYRVIECRYRDPNPRRTARFVKTHLHVLLPDYDVVIWTDANVMLRGPLDQFVRAVVDAEADLGVIYHPIRATYEEEAIECIRINADEPAVIEEQIKTYSAVSRRFDPLIETNFFVADVRSPRTKQFFDLWWREIASRSLRDQLSVNFAIQESEAIHIPLLPGGTSTRDDGRFAHFAHGIRDRSTVRVSPAEDQ